MKGLQFRKGVFVLGFVFMALPFRTGFIGEGVDLIGSSEVRELKELNFKRFILSLVTGLLLSLAMPWATCYACSCTAMTFEQKIENAEHIFTGKVVGIWHSKQMNQTKVEFEVMNVYKGDVPSASYVYSNAISSMCGISFEFNKSYLVFKSSNGTTSFCSGTVAINDEIPLYERLGEPLQMYDHVSSKAVTNIKLRLHYEEIGTVRIDSRERALIPLEDHLLEELGIVRLSEPDDHKQIRLAKGNTEVTVFTGSNLLQLNPDLNYMDTVSILDADLIYAPIRDLMEAFNFSVVWNEKDRSITLKDNNAVVSMLLKKENFGKLEAFIKNVRNRVPDNMRIIRYTIDSGPIYIDLDYQADSIRMQFDPARDKITVENAYTVSCRSMIWEEQPENGKLQLLLLDGCLDGQKHYLLSVHPNLEIIN
jgi:outer membrane lipoprotein-sorting protein